VDIARVRALVELVASRPIAELTLSEGGSRIRIVKAPSGAPVAPAWRAPPAMSPPLPAAKTEAPHAAPDEEMLVRAPTTGIFHRSPAPGEPPFVAEGDRVTPVQQLCVIEAMKVITTVTAEREGRITAVLAANGEMIQADQPLFRIG